MLFEFGKRPFYHYILTDLNPCLGVHCPSFGICKTFSAYESRCVCYEDCPSYQDPVCTTNGTTYDNQCWYELNYCRGLEKNSVYHPGSCEGKWKVSINQEKFLLFHIPSVPQSTDPSIDPSTDPSTDPSIHPPRHPYIHQFIQASINPSIHQSINPSRHSYIN